MFQRHNLIPALQVAVVVLVLLIVAAFIDDDIERTRAAQVEAPVTIGLAPYGAEFVTYDRDARILTIHPKRMPQNAEICIAGDVVWCGIPAQAPSSWTQR